MQTNHFRYNCIIEWFNNSQRYKISNGSIFSSYIYLDFAEHRLKSQCFYWKRGGWGGGGILKGRKSIHIPCILWSEPWPHQISASLRTPTCAFLIIPLRDAVHWSSGHFSILNRAFFLPDESLEVGCAQTRIDKSLFSMFGQGLILVLVWFCT